MQMVLERVVEPGGLDPGTRETRTANAKDSFVAQGRRTVVRSHSSDIFGGICYGCYWLTADEPVVTDEAYARMAVSKDMCRGEALIRYPDDEKTQDAHAEACSQRLWPTFVKPYL
jgi:hypothetical protein